MIPSVMRRSFPAVHPFGTAAFKHQGDKNSGRPTENPARCRALGDVDFLARTVVRFSTIFLKKSKEF